jgi:tRNA(adenine34) deaminase
VATCYFGATDPKAGVAGTFYNLLADTRFNHQVAVVSGIKADESATLLQTFFRTIRAKRKAAKRAGQTSENQL